MNDMLAKYANLLVNYCLELQQGERLYIKSTTLAEPLVREVYRYATRAGAHVEIDLEMEHQHRIFMEEANEEQLRYVSPLYRAAVETFDAYLYIRAPFSLRNTSGNHPEKVKIRQEAIHDTQQKYFARTATRELKRNLCQYPTEANAREAGMSLEEYQEFVFNACCLYTEDPIKAWLNVRASQQKIVDLLNSKETIRYKGDGTDITFSTKGRTWINSDGQTNMPSGEVYTSPVENAVNGVIRFTYPAIYMGQEVEDVRLWVKDGCIEKWEAKKGQDLLDYIFEIPGTRRFGEAAIGTNYSIQRFTKNMLFDEKIGGTVHMALGQSYLQTGGKNQSSIHWDMIADMSQGGEIFANNEKIYENGQFLFV